MLKKAILTFILIGTAYSKNELAVRNNTSINLYTDAWSIIPCQTLPNNKLEIIKVNQSEIQFYTNSTCSKPSIGKIKFSLTTGIETIYVYQKTYFLRGSGFYLTLDPS